jgi:hypothetical protein
VGGLQDYLGVNADFFADAVGSISFVSCENMTVWPYVCQCLITASVESLEKEELVISSLRRFEQSGWRRPHQNATVIGEARRKSL